MGSIAEIYRIFTLCHDFEMNFLNFFKRRAYLDFAAATPLDPQVAKVMRQYEAIDFANPSAIHKEGVRARAAVESARQKIATTLGIRAEGVLFTGSGTESNNLAILGYVKYLARERGVAYSDMEIVTTALEHPSVGSLLPILESTGVVVRQVPVNEFGQITTKALAEVLSAKTVLVTFAYANSEIGVVQNISRLARQVRESEKKFGTKIVIHIDAAQAPLWLPCEMVRLGVDMLSLDAGKCFGPKGVGVLARRGGVALLPIMYGGGQEQGLRPGTESAAAIVGAASAIEKAQTLHIKRAEEVMKVRDRAIALILKELPGTVLNGPTGVDRLANNINFSLPRFDTEYAVVYLDTYGVAASTKSACAGAGGGESVVVKAITNDAERARSTIRLSLGPKSTLSEVALAVKILKRFCEKMTPLTK